MVVFKKIVSFLSYVCYFLILLYSVVCIPMIAGYRPVVVLSGSMEPTLPVGSVAYYKAMSKEEIKENDIITFQMSNGVFVSHRVNRILEDGEYETKGDANNSADPQPISYQDVVGKVANFSIPYIGFYIQFIKNHFYIIGIVVVILVSEFLLSNIRAFDIDKNKERSIENGK